MAEVWKPGRKSVLLRVEPELLDRIDAAAGDVPRQRWIVGRLEEALGGSPPRGGSSAAGPASPRASSESTVVEAANRSKEEQNRVKRELLAGLEGDGSGGPPPSTQASNTDKPIVPPEGDGECPHTPAQLAGMAKVPVATAARKIKDGSWRGLL